VSAWWASETKIHLEKNVPHIHVRPASLRRKSQSFIHIPLTLFCQLLSLLGLYAGSRAMSTPQEMLARVWCLADWKSVTVVQKRFRIGHGRETLPIKRIRFRRQRVENYMGSVYVKNLREIYRCLNKTWIYHRNAFRRVPHTPIFAASNQLPIPRSALHQILQETLQQLTRFDYFKRWNRLTQCPLHSSKHVEISISSVPRGVPTLQFTKIVVSVAILSGSEV
jgi:hypothetical protein